MPSVLVTKLLLRFEEKVAHTLVRDNWACRWATLHADRQSVQCRIRTAAATPQTSLGHPGFGFAAVLQASWLNLLTRKAARIASRPYYQSRERLSSIVIDTCKFSGAFLLLLTPTQTTWADSSVGSEVKKQAKLVGISCVFNAKLRRTFQ